MDLWFCDRVPRVTLGVSGAVRTSPSGRYGNKVRAMCETSAKKVNPARVVLHRQHLKSATGERRVFGLQTSISLLRSSLLILWLHGGDEKNQSTDINCTMALKAKQKVENLQTPQSWSVSGWFRSKSDWVSLSDFWRQERTEPLQWQRKNKGPIPVSRYPAASGVVKSYKERS